MTAKSVEHLEITTNEDNLSVKSGLSHNPSEDDDKVDEMSIMPPGKTTN